MYHSVSGGLQLRLERYGLQYQLQQVYQHSVTALNQVVGRCFRVLSKRL